MGRRDKRRKIENRSGVTPRNSSIFNRSSVQAAIEEGLRQQRSKAADIVPIPVAVIEADSQPLSSNAKISNQADQQQFSRKDFVGLLIRRQLDLQQERHKWSTIAANFRLLSEVTKPSSCLFADYKYHHATLHPHHGVLFKDSNSINLCANATHSPAAKILLSDWPHYVLDISWASATVTPSFFILNHTQTMPVLSKFYIHQDGSLRRVLMQSPSLCSALDRLDGFTEHTGYAYGESQLNRILFSEGFSTTPVFSDRERRIRSVAADPNEHDYVAVGLRNGQILFSNNPQGLRSSFQCLGTLPFCIDLCHWLQKGSAPQLLVRDVCGNMQLFDVRRAKHPVSILKEGNANVCRKVGFWVSPDERLVVTQDETNGMNTIQDVIGIYPIYPQAGDTCGGEKIANPLKMLRNVDMETVVAETLTNWDNWDIFFPRTVNLNLEEENANGHSSGGCCYVIVTNRENQMQRLLSLGNNY